SGSMLVGFADAGEMDAFLRFPFVPFEILRNLDIREIGWIAGGPTRLQMECLDVAPGPLLKEPHEFPILLDRPEDVPERHIGIDMAGAAKDMECGRDLLLDVLPRIAVPFKCL